MTVSLPSCTLPLKPISSHFSDAGGTISDVPFLAKAVTGTDTDAPAVSGAVEVPAVRLDKSSPPSTVTLVEALAVPLAAVRVAVPALTAVASPPFTVTLPLLAVQEGLPEATSIGL
ncbi:hypothetical protein D3C75_683450 [compost metagenome]